MLGGVGRSWQQRSPTSRKEPTGNLQWVCTTGRQVTEGGVTSNGVPFMAPLECDPHLITPADGEFWRNSSPVSFVLVMTLCAQEFSPSQLLALRKMAEGGSNSSAGSTTDGSGGRLKRGSGSGGREKTSVDVREGGGGEVNQGECWFNLETSSVERRALFRLEREMDATLMFEYGGSQRESQLWVTKILLGRLFQERLSLGRAVKSFAKFQCREIMRGLVKLNELEEVAEPALGNLLKASTLSMPKHDTQDLDDDEASLEDEGEEACFSPGESQLGLL